MARDNIFVGLEIGTSKICAVVAEARHDGSLKIIGVGNAPARGVRKGEIVDFETAKRCVHDAIVDAEEKSDVEISEVYRALKGFVAQETSGAQTPWLVRQDVVGDFSLF